MMMKDIPAPSDGLNPPIEVCDEATRGKGLEEDLKESPQRRKSLKSVAISMVHLFKLHRLASDKKADDSNEEVVPNNTNKLHRLALDKKADDSNEELVPKDKTTTKKKGISSYMTPTFTHKLRIGSHKHHANFLQRKKKGASLSPSKKRQQGKVYAFKGKDDEDSKGKVPVHEKNNTPVKLDEKGFLVPSSEEKQAPQLFCAPCGMHFTSAARLKTHTEHSSLHQKVTRELEAQARRALEGEAEDRRQRLSLATASAAGWQRLFQGRHLFWRQGREADVVLWVNRQADLVAVYTSLHGQEGGAGAIYLRWSVVTTFVDLVALEKEVRRRAAALRGAARAAALAGAPAAAREAEARALADWLLGRLRLRGGAAPSPSPPRAAPAAAAAAAATESQEEKEGRTGGPVVVDNGGGGGVGSGGAEEKDGVTLEVTFWVDASKPQEAALLLSEPPTSVALPQQQQANEVPVQGGLAAVGMHRSAQHQINDAMEHHRRAAAALEAARRAAPNALTAAAHLAKLQSEAMGLAAKAAALELRIDEGRRALAMASDKTERELKDEYEAAKQKISVVSKREIALLKSMRKPKQHLEDLFGLVLLMLGKKDTSWNSAVLLMGGSLHGSFVDEVLASKFEDFSPIRLKKFLMFVESHPEALNRELQAQANAFAGVLAEYILARYHAFLGSKSTIQSELDGLQRSLSLIKQDEKNVQSQVKGQQNAMRKAGGRSPKRRSEDWEAAGRRGAAAAGGGGRGGRQGWGRARGLLFLIQLQGTTQDLLQQEEDKRADVVNVIQKGHSRRMSL